MLDAVKEYVVEVFLPLAAVVAVVVYAGYTYLSMPTLYMCVMSDGRDAVAYCETDGNRHKADSVECRSVASGKYVVEWVEPGECLNGR